ncbi:hypothetical protein [Streptomyces sp. NPDC057909]|uniref:hypothetical protein n=1 Tax=Streptomyces sp. NPDC057909 TaxID=3346277 RepID=UPI0036EEE0A4
MKARILPLAIVATAALVTGCSSGTSEDAAKPAPVSTPAPPTGVGPYPVPSNAAATPSPKPRPSRTLRRPHGGIPSPQSVDQRDATAVSKGALTAMLTYDTTTDSSRNEASRRMVAAGWCTAAYGAKLSGPVNPPAPGAGWEKWASHRAYTTVDLTSADQAGRPADTQTTAYRQWAVAITPHGRDEWTGPPETYTAFVELIRSGKGASWRLNSLSLQ